MAPLKWAWTLDSLVPKQYWPVGPFYEECLKVAKETGATITCTDNVAEGVKGLDIIYTGVWVTMGGYVRYVGRTYQHL